MTRVREVAPTIERALRISTEGIPGPVFVELPVDVLYPEETVREWYDRAAPDRTAKGIRTALRRWYLARHLSQMFARGARPSSGERVIPALRRRVPMPSVRRAVDLIRESRRPVFLLGSQAAQPARVRVLHDAVESIGAPTYLSGMARGLLGPRHPLYFRHRRRAALRDADLVLLGGVPADFRLGYGSHLEGVPDLIAVNLSDEELTRNLNPSVAAVAGTADFLEAVAVGLQEAPDWSEWVQLLQNREDERDRAIEVLSGEKTEYVHPVTLCREVERVMPDDAVVVVDGGDFAATASYVIRARGPLRWLDPGVFGTLGAGAGFALGARLCHPDSQVWILYGDGSAPYSLAEFDSAVRHGLPLVGVVGNDGAWTQIARGQISMLKDDVGTTLRRTDYHKVVEGYGGKGYLVKTAAELEQALASALADASRGVPALVNCWMGDSSFRSGSISM